LKNEPEKLLKTQDHYQKTNRNEPKNEAGKFLKIRTCGKNEPENKAGHVVEKIRRQNTGASLSGGIRTASAQRSRCLRGPRVLTQSARRPSVLMLIRTQKAPGKI
jgi:hypothetical protein